MLKNRLSKLEKIQRDKQLGNGGIYLVYTDKDTMIITSGQDQLFSGPVESGEKMINELDIPGSLIIKLNVPRAWAE